jgi:hypothetical protein
MIKQCPRLAVNRRRRAISPARGLRWKRGTVGARQRTTCCGQRSWPGRSFPFRAPVPRGLLLLLLYKSARAPRRLGLPPRRLLSPSPPSRQQTQSRSSRASSDVSLSPVAVRRQPKHLARGARSSSPHQIFFFIVPPPLRVGSCGSSHFLAAGPSRDSLLTRTRTGKKPEEEDVRGATAPVLRRRRRGRG